MTGLGCLAMKSFIYYLVLIRKVGLSYPIINQLLTQWERLFGLINRFRQMGWKLGVCFTADLPPLPEFYIMVLAKWLCTKFKSTDFLEDKPYKSKVSESSWAGTAEIYSRLNNVPYIGESN